VKLKFAVSDLISNSTLIAELIRRDLPYYDPIISEDFVAAMNSFARYLGILKGQLACTDVVTTQFKALLKA
jgi:hypothetical protein